MTLKQKIIFSSTMVAVMAGIAGIISWKNSKAIRGVYVEKVELWNKEHHALEEITRSMATVYITALKGATPSSDGKYSIENRDGQFLTSVENLRSEIEQYAAYGTRQKDVGHTLLQLLPPVVTAGQSLQYPFSGTAAQRLPQVTQLEEVQHAFMLAINEAKIAGFAECQAVGLHTNSIFKSISNWTVGASFFIFLMAIVFGQLIARDLSMAIENLKTTAKQMEAGNFSVGKILKRKDEFGKLAHSFNDLAKDLQKTKIIEVQNEELELLNTELKKKNDSLDSFVYRVSHDLKAPVVNLKSLLKIVDGQVETQQNEVLNKTLLFINKTSEKLEQTIHDLLEVSRIERNLESYKELLSIKEILDDIVLENKTEIDHNQVSIITDFDQTGELYFSKANLKSLLSNLITNAIKYRSMDRRLEIVLQTAMEGEYVRLSISDNGIGIDLDKHRKKLFGMFNRFHDHVEGSGVGLYIVKKLIDENGGKLEIESKVNEGTTLHLFFSKKEAKADVLVEPALA